MLNLVIFNTVFKFFLLRVPLDINIFQFVVKLGNDRLLVFQLFFHLLDLVLKGFSFFNLFSKHLIKLLLHSFNMKFQLLFNTNVSPHISLKLLYLFFIWPELTRISSFFGFLVKRCHLLIINTHLH